MFRAELMKFSHLASKTYALNFYNILIGNALNEF
jgi:hypothetical protein